MNISLFPFLMFGKEPGRHGEVQKGLDRFGLSGIPSSPSALAFIAFVSIFVAAPTHFYLLDSPTALSVPTSRHKYNSMLTDVVFGSAGRARLRMMS